MSIKRLCMILIAAVITVFHYSAVDVSAASNPYPTTQDWDGDGNYEVPCTRFAWQQVYDNLGVALPAWGNAGTWLDSARNAGISTGTVAKAGSVAVWVGGGAGHVAYVTSASGNTFTVNEGGRTDLDHTSSHGVAYGYTLTNAVGAARPYDTGKTLVGFIYPNGGGNWYDSFTPVNAGDDFYANIIKADGWATVGCINDDNVEIIKYIGDGSDVWHFVRQPDGSYVIYNCHNNKVLDVECASAENGGNVHVYEYVGLDNQKWYIYGKWNGEYFLRPKNSNKTLDVSNGGNAIGTNVQIWDRYDCAAQKFSLYEQPKAGSSVLSVSAGDSDTATIISWTTASNATHYNIALSVKDEASGEYRSYPEEIWNRTGNSYSIILPAGSYRAWLGSCNSYSYSGSNIVEFTVRQGQGSGSGGSTVTEPDNKPDGETGNEPDSETGNGTGGETGNEPDNETGGETGNKPDSEMGNETGSEQEVKPDSKPEVKPVSKPEVKPVSETGSRPEETLKKPKLYKPSSYKKKTMKAYWYYSGNDVSGFQVQYAKNKAFTKSKKTKNVGSSKESVTIKKLKSKSICYVRVRAYKIINGQMIYGQWSNVKKTRIS